MHPDLSKLLDVQDKDHRLAETAARIEALAQERAELDRALDSARSQIAGLSRAAADVAARRDEREQKLEHQRSLQDRRRERLEQERNPRVAAQLMADLDLARGILQQEEAEWIRLSDEAINKTNAVTQAEATLAELETEQAEARGDIGARQQAAEAEHAVARTAREEAARGLERSLRVRYDRLHGSRRSEVLVPASNGNCTSCHTAIPRSRIGKLQAEGVLLEGCEMCGAILYVTEASS
ncbi:MAG TPA: hypothetical protein PLL69_07305 [Gemmatimonadales bacterium]|nr:hypothetical protein [Gemmatimonadales bacterium]